MRSASLLPSVVDPSAREWATKAAPTHSEPQAGAHVGTGWTETANITTGGIIVAHENDLFQNSIFTLSF
jgi:hypothetical protein